MTKTANTIQISKGGSMDKFDIEEGVLLGYKTDVSIVDEILSIPEGVIQIDCEAFADNECIREVHISNTVKEIGQFAFSNCYNLERITFGESVETIENNAFFFCIALKKIELPASILYVGPSAFGFCAGIKKVVMQEGVRLIGNNAFETCLNLEDISLPMSLRAIGAKAFDSCDKLPRLSVPTGTKVGVDISTNKTVVAYTLACWDKRMGRYGNAGAIAWANKCMEDPSNTPAAWNDDYIDIFSEMLDIRKNVIYGFKSGFENDMPHLFIPSGVIKIADNAFSKLESLKSVFIPDSVINVGDFAFYGCCNLQHAHLSTGLKIIGVSAFGATGLEEIEIPLGAFRIEIDCFSNCLNLKTVKINNGVVSIGFQAFKDCKALCNIEIPTTTKYMGTAVFSGCSNLKCITFPRRINALRECVFKDCINLEAVVLMNGTGMIHRKAFDGCVNLKSIVTTTFGKHIARAKTLSKFTYNEYSRHFRKTLAETCKRLIVEERPRLLRG